MIIDGQTLGSIKFNKILEDQLTISVLSKGAITIADTNNMPISDRQHLLNILVDLEEKKQAELRRLADMRKK